MFLDLQIAFDYRDHNIIFYQLYNLGVRGLALGWIKSYLTNRCQKVKVINGSQSKNVYLSFEIPRLSSRSNSL